MRTLVRALGRTRSTGETAQRTTGEVGMGALTALRAHLGRRERPERDDLGALVGPLGRLVARHELVQAAAHVPLVAVVGQADQPLDHGLELGPGPGRGLLADEDLR